MKISKEEFENLADLLNYHLAVHEGVELTDIYKLVHQSVFGPGHLGAGASVEAINEEMEVSGSDFGEPLLESISVDGRVCRINLRPAREKTIAPEIISGAMRRSIDKFGRDISRFERLWEKVGASLSDLSRSFSVQEFEELTSKARDGGYPAMRHSPSYREQNRPSYRVALRQDFDIIMRQQSPVADR